MVVGSAETTATMAMRKNVALRNMFSYNFSGANLLQTEAFRCEQWSCAQVADWIRGIDEATSNYAENFVSHNVEGSKLLNFDDYSLRKVSINKVAVRKKILNGIALLVYYTDTINQDNLQRAAMNVTVSTTNMLSAIGTATAVINNPSQSARVFEVLNAVLCAVTDVYTNVRRLMCWLDRSPFDDKTEFITIREKISAFIKEMIDCVNNLNNPKFFSVPQLLVERGKRIQEVCTKIVRMKDPSILYTTYLERVTIHKSVPSHWGFEVSSMFTGMGMVTRVNLETPAGISGKIDVGDEILEINGKAVVGWSLPNLMQIINNGAFLPSSERAPKELALLLNKRPREIWAALPMGATGGRGALPPATPLTPSRPTTLFESSNERMKMMLDFKMKIQPDLMVRNQEINPPLSARARSFSFNLLMSSPPPEPCERCTIPTGRCLSLFVSNSRRQVSRRASVWNESPPAMVRSPLDGLRYQMESNAWLLLLASWGNNGRQKAGGGFFGRSSGGQLTPRPLSEAIKDEECDYSFDEAKKTLNLSEIDYSNVETISDKEVDRLKVHFRLPNPSIHDSDWNRPIRDITGLKMVAKRTHLESGSNTSIIDSPLSTIQAKITRFFYGDPSPSHSASSNTIASGSTSGTTSGQNSVATTTTTTAAVVSVALPDTISTSVSSEKLVVDTAACRTPLAGRIEHYLFGSTGGSSSSSVNSPLPLMPSATNSEKFVVPTRRGVGTTSAVLNGGASGAKKMSGSVSQSNIVGASAEQPQPARMTMTPTGTTITTMTMSSIVGGDTSQQSSQIKTAGKNANKGTKLVPLAEPDEVGELSSIPRMSDKNKSTGGFLSLQTLAAIPCRQLARKTHEGSVRRQKLLLLDSQNTYLKRNERGSQWIKCWMVLKDEIFYVYRNENSHEADLVINLSYFYLTTDLKTSDMKTTKKHVFALCWNSEMLNFAPFTSDELKQWLAHLRPLTRKFSNSTNTMQQSLDADEERLNALYVRSTPPTSTDDGGGTASGSTGPPTPSPLFAKTMGVPPPLSPSSVASSTTSSNIIAFTTPLPSPRSSNFTFLPTKIFSKGNRHGSLHSQNQVGGKVTSSLNTMTMTSSISTSGIAYGASTLSTTVVNTATNTSTKAQIFFPSGDTPVDENKSILTAGCAGGEGGGGFCATNVSISISGSSPPPVATAVNYPTYKLSDQHHSNLTIDETSTNDVKDDERVGMMKKRRDAGQIFNELSCVDREQIHNSDI